MADDAAECDGVPSTRRERQPTVDREEIDRQHMRLVLILGHEDDAIGTSFAEPGTGREPARTVEQTRLKARPEASGYSTTRTKPDTLGTYCPVRALPAGSAARDAPYGRGTDRGTVNWRQAGCFHTRW